jgi:plasmid stabilization system protein ParE
MTFTVEFSDEAEKNARDIRDWIAKRSPAGALRWLDALDRASDRLRESAESFALAPESDAFAEDFRQLPFHTARGNTYRLLYIIRGTTVHVVSVRGAGQDLLKPEDIPPL